MSQTTGYPTKRRVFGVGELIAVLILLLASAFVLEDVRLGSSDCDVGSTLEASAFRTGSELGSGEGALSHDRRDMSPGDCEPGATPRFAER